MIMSHRTVLIGEGLRPDTPIDIAIDRIAALAGETTIALAVLDRSSSQASLAVAVRDSQADDLALLQLLASELAPLFEHVVVAESSIAGLAVEDRLT